MKKVAITIPQTGWQTLKTKYLSDDPINVKSDDLTGSSQNFDSIVKGILTKRSGGIDYNPTTFSSPAKDQFEAIFTDGVHHLLIVEGGNLRFSSGGGTFTLVTSGYSSLGNFEFALYNDRVYFDNGIDSPQVYDRTTSYGGVSYSAPQTKVMGAQAPSSAPTFAADTAGGNVPAGAHTYKITFLYYDFEESNGGPASAVHTVANPNNTVNLTSLPIGGYGVTARKIYRDDNDGNWLLVGTVANNTATVFSDTASIGTAQIPISNNVPPSFEFIVTNLDRTWIAGIPGDPSSLRFSEAGLPDIFPSANDILCNPEDPITALVVYDKKVWVFNRNSIGRILGSTRDTFQYVPLPGSVGCVDNRSIRVRTIEGIPTLIWLSDKGIYGTNGSSIEYLSDAIEDLVNLNIQQAAQVRGQNAQTSQSQFQAGTASPGIDLTSSPGFITTPNPRRLWDDEADWEGGSSLTNVATNLTGNQLRVPIRTAPAFSSGTHANTVEISGTLRTPISGNFTGETSGNGGDSGALSTAFPSPVQGKEGAIPIIPTVTGTLTSVQIFVGVQNTGSWAFTVWDDLGGTPNNILFSQSLGSPPNLTIQTYNFSPGTNMTGGQKYYYGVRRVSGTGGIIAPSGTVTFTGGHVLARHNTNNTWSNATILHQSSPFDTVDFPRWRTSYVFTKTPVATTGLWTGPIYDSLSDSAVAATIQHTGTFGSGTSSNTTVEASNDPTMTTGVISQSFANLVSPTAVSLSNKRYWRIKIALSASDDRFTAQIGPPTLRFSTNAVWISEAIDHTTDITALNALSSVTSVPLGTSVTIEIATSANNITYSSFTSLGSAVAQRYSKVRVTLSSTVDNVVTPTVTSVQLDWTLVSNLVSSGIDTGSVPAGWDIFQAQFATNGGTIAFHMRSATTLGGLSAETFVAVTNGQFPTIPVRQFVQWRVTLTSTAGSVPTVDSVTVNWFISQVSSIRVASIFYNRSYYLAAAEFNQTANNIVIVLDGEGKWRVYRGLNINTFSFFFNEPYYGSSLEGRIVRFLSGATDQGDPIQMIVETKAFDFGDLEHTKIGRKVYIKGKNTGAVYQVFMSFDEGSTYYPMLDVITGMTSFTTSTDNKRFRRRFQLDFTNGNVTSGKTVKVKVVENTAASAELDEMRLEAWIRRGELVG